MCNSNSLGLEWCIHPESFYVCVNASNIESWVFVFFNEFDAVSLLYAGFFLLTTKILLHF